MTNLEYYKDKIVNYKDTINFCDEFISPKILKQCGRVCGEISCSQCRLIQAVWLLEGYKEYEEPEPDWSTVAVDTPILVSGNGESWHKRHFAKYENGEVYAWNDGQTSFTTNDTYNCTIWSYAKLAEEVE